MNDKIENMKHLLSSKELTQEETLKLLARAKEFLPVVRHEPGGAGVHKRVGLAEGKLLATLFYEPSTRTRFSFETAMFRLGGGVISNAQMETASSAKKGETLFDTGRVVSEMADIIAVRHYREGACAELALGSRVPVINAGDGAGDHPTQGLLDIFTISEELGRLTDFTIAMVGDLKNSRVLHSECALLKHFSGVKFLFVSPEGLKMPDQITEDLKASGFSVTEMEKLEGAIAEADVISHTRIQQERFASEEEYLKYKGVYVITPDIMKTAKESAILMHPLPRVDEIDRAVDLDPRAKYFEQVSYGVTMRMAILAELLGV